MSGETDYDLDVYQNAGDIEENGPSSIEEEYTQPDYEPEEEEIHSVNVLTEQEARDALEIFVSEHCCYGKRPQQLMKIENMQSSNAFHYSLETFGESRSLKLTFTPYIGGHFGDISLMRDRWDYRAEPKVMFQNSKLKVELPNSSVIKPCHFCNGRCQVMCLTCVGRGQVLCFSCNGAGTTAVFFDGRHQRSLCNFCMGSGRNICYICHGTGNKTCSSCLGSGQMRWYYILKIKWINHMDSFVLQSTDLPDRKIVTVPGELVFEDKAQQVQPVDSFQEEEINTASQSLITQHRETYAGEKFLMQRQKIRIVPVTMVNYSYKEKEGTYHVYGLDHKVYAPDYPQKCCGCCTVL